jgi:predicted cupin superfamily sugar epimerase
VTRAASLIHQLGLIAHPEGGYYGEVYRSAAIVEPLDGRGPRSALTTIYFLLPQGTISRWHRVRSDEIWHFYEGAPLHLWVSSPERAEIERLCLGPLGATQQPVRSIAAGWWQAARSSGEYTLVGCTVGPGFDYRDFSLAAELPDAPALLRRAPEHAQLW